MVNAGADGAADHRPIPTQETIHMSRKTLPLLALAAAGVLAAPAALAQSAGDWTLGVGVHNVDPKSDNGRLDATALGLGPLPPTSVGNSVRPTITAEYFIRDNLGIEVLAALPFHHDISVRGVGKVGSTRHLPPVVSLQYHFTNSTQATPFLGLGVNYTTFFSEETTGALAGTKLELDDSWGLAAHVGLDFAVGERGALRIDARWADIESDVKVNGIKVGTADIDPLVYGVAYVWRF